MGNNTIRPDSIDLLFLGSFLDPFERVERIKKKKNVKNGKHLHEKKKSTTICETNSIFLKLLSLSHFMNAQEDPRNNKSIESGLSDKAPTGSTLSRCGQ